MNKSRNFCTVNKSPVVTTFYDGLIQLRLLANGAVRKRYILVRTQDILDRKFMVDILGEYQYNKVRCKSGYANYAGCAILEKHVKEYLEENRL